MIIFEIVKIVRTVVVVILYKSQVVMMSILVGEIRVLTSLEIGRDGLVNGLIVVVNARTWGAVTAIGAIVYLKYIFLVTFV